MALTAFAGARIFNGTRWFEEHALLIEGGRIADIVPRMQVPAEAAVCELGGGLLAPGFVDAQVNGGGGVLFNETPEPAALARLCAAHGRFGSTALMPTYITGRPEGMALAIEAARQAIAAGVPGVVGLHLEGPFLSVARKGAHDPALIRTLTDADVDLLLDTGIETLLVTVAVESAAPCLIRRLVDGGVIVSLGHSDASFEATMAAADAGATGITHLFNAMSPLQHRAPGVVGAALAHGGLWCGIIADGHHVHPAALSSAIRAKAAPSRLFLVTDAMPTAGDPGDTFRINGRLVTRRDGVLTLDDGTLAGSDLTMDAALRFAVAHLGIGLDEALRMASLHPAIFLKLDRDRGRLAPGRRADIVHLDAHLKTAGVWIGGRRLD